MCSLPFMGGTPREAGPTYVPRPSPGNKATASSLKPLLYCRRSVLESLSVIFVMAVRFLPKLIRREINLFGRDTP